MKGWQLADIDHADLNPILAIERRSFRWPWGRPAFEGELRNRNARCYGVKAAGRQFCDPILAYAFLQQAVDEVHLLKVAVTPAWRGQGMAVWLLARCFELSAARGARSAHLEVRPSNIPAVALYRKLGFETVGRRPNYYTDSKEDALLMSKMLKEDL